jgi:hypothetical protein
VWRFWLQYEGDPGAAPIITGLTPDRTSVRLDNLATQVEANPCTACAIRPVHTMMLDAKELLEYTLTELWGNARTGVRHGNLQESLAISFAILP